MSLFGLMLMSGCSMARTFVKAKKSGPTTTVTKMVEGQPVVTVTEGEVYKTVDKATAIRIASPFGLSAGETVVNRDGVNIDAAKGTIVSGKGSLGWLERTYLGIRTWLIWGVIAVFACFGLSFVPVIGPFFGSIFSMIPIIGGYFAKFKAEKTTKEVIHSVQVAKGTLSNEDRAAFNAVLDQEQDKETKRIIKGLK